MKLHEDECYLVSKRVNGGMWMTFAETYKGGREAAESRAEQGREFHLSRCPNDQVEFSITKVF